MPLLFLFKMIDKTPNGKSCYEARNGSRFFFIGIDKSKIFYSLIFRSGDKEIRTDAKGKAFQGKEFDLMRKINL